MNRVWLRRVLLFQSIYYLITAIWPIVSLETFIMFAGEKPDRFIFWTVDFLILVIAVTILFGVWREQLETAAFLGALAALAFMIVEVWFSDQISDWFWADFAVETAILLGILTTVFLLRKE